VTSEAGQVNVECFLCSAPTKVCQRAPVTLTKGRAANSSKVIAQSVFRVAQRLECTIRYLLSCEPRHYSQRHGRAPSRTFKVEGSRAGGCEQMTPKSWNAPGLKVGTPSGNGGSDGTRTRGLRRDRPAL
jgi:hypothetical protein